MNRREKILIGMNEIIMSLNNENKMDAWLSCGVPDGADDEYIKDMANDDEEFKWCVSLFLDIVREKGVWQDGLYIEKELGVINYNTRREVD